MNKILAIKGDRNRGNEIIALLQMLGGENNGNAVGYDETAIYVIPVNGIIDVQFNYINYATALNNAIKFTCLNIKPTIDLPVKILVFG